MNAIVPLAMVAPIAIFFAASVEWSKVQDRNQRLEARYRRERNLEDERRQCVNFIVSHGMSIAHREPYALLMKKLDGQSTALDESMLKLRVNALAHARKRIREINVELGNSLYAFYAKEHA